MGHWFRRTVHTAICHKLLLRVTCTAVYTVRSDVSCNQALLHNTRPDYQHVVSADVILLIRICAFVYVNKSGYDSRI